GNIYVADSNNNRIQKFSSTGQVLQHWGSYGQGPGQFVIPSGVAVDAQGNLFVVDQNNARIQKLAPDGHPLAQWGTFGFSYGDDTTSLTFSNPTGITFDAGGNLLITDSGANRIVKLSTTGKQLAAWGDWGDDPVEFKSPLGITVDGQGNIVVA